MACPDLLERTIVLNGVSKAYAMTGWRIGYAAGPKAIMDAMKKVQSQSTSNPTSIAQAAALEALTGDQGCMGPMLRAFRERHDWLVPALNRLSGFRCLPSDGTFYAFPSVEGTIASRPGIADDVALAELVLNEAGVALVPGSAFGTPGYLRLSFAAGLDVLTEAVARLEKLFGTVAHTR
jgi:aspartate aminotransferase